MNHPKTGDEELERLAEDSVETWHKKNNWVPTDRSCMPSIAAFQAGYRAHQSETELLRKRVKEFVTGWGYVKCHDGTYVYFPTRICESLKPFVGKETRVTIEVIEADDKASEGGVDV